MVGKRETKTEVNSEYFKNLKQNNISLAKALTEERLTCKQYLEERIALQRKLDASLLLNFRYETILSKLLAESKKTVPVCTAILTNIQQIIKYCSEGVNLPKLINSEFKEKSTLPPNINNKRSASPVVNKTHAVKPMVSGHVIFRPTINLWRLTDTEPAELTRNLDSPSAELAESPSTSNDNVNNRPVNLEVSELPNLYDLDITDSDILTETNNEIDTEEPILNGRVEGLEPVEEEPEIEHELNRQEFTIREARVVIDPLSVLQTPSPPPKRRLNNSLNEDPLEGPSTLLDDSGQFTSPPSKYVSKPRAASSHFSLLVNKKPGRMCNSDSDSSSDDEIKRKPVQNRNISKRKLVAFKTKDETTKDETTNTKSEEEPKRQQHKKIKKTEPTHSPSLLDIPIGQPFVVLRREDLSMLDTSRLSTDSKESPSPQFNDQNVTDRPRRNKLKGSFKEKSLRCKLRRDK